MKSFGMLALVVALGLTLSAQAQTSTQSTDTQAPDMQAPDTQPPETQAPPASPEISTPPPQNTFSDTEDSSDPTNSQYDSRSSQTGDQANHTDYSKNPYWSPQDRDYNSNSIAGECG